MAGLFLTFEGIDGCGKTTLAEALVRQLRTEGQSVVFTREPGGTPLGQRIRNLVLSGVEPLPERAELLLFAADRALHVASLIRPALASGQIVISDRFADSTRAYQGFGRGMDRALIEQTVALATAGLAPDLTVLVDVDVETSRRRKPPTDRIERDDDAFFERVRAGYLSLHRSEPDRIRVVDGRIPVVALLAQVTALVHQRLG